MPRRRSRLAMTERRRRRVDELKRTVETSIERIHRFADIADSYCPDGKQGYYLSFPPEKAR